MAGKTDERMDVIDLVAFILRRDDMLLIEQRKLDKRFEPGKVGIPAGTIREKETHEQALVREAKTQLGIEPESMEYIGTLPHPSGKHYFRTHFYIVSRWKGEPKPLEAESISWLALHESGRISIWPHRLITEAVKLLTEYAPKK